MAVAVAVTEVVEDDEPAGEDERSAGIALHTALAHLSRGSPVADCVDVVVLVAVAVAVAVWDDDEEDEPAHDESASRHREAHGARTNQWTFHCAAHQWPTA